MTLKVFFTKNILKNSQIGNFNFQFKNSFSLLDYYLNPQKQWEMRNNNIYNRIIIKNFLCRKNAVNWNWQT